MWPASNDSPVRCLFGRSSEGSVVPRLSDLEPDGRRSWPLEASRPPWLALGVAVRSGAGLVRGQGGTWGGFDECRRRGRAINNSPAEKALGPSQRAERTRFYADDKARSIRQWEISWSDRMPMGEKMTSLAQCSHAEIEIKRDEGRRRSGRWWALSGAGEGGQEACRDN